RLLGFAYFHAIDIEMAAGGILVDDEDRVLCRCVGIAVAADPQLLPLIVLGAPSVRTADKRAELYRYMALFHVDPCREHQFRMDELRRQRLIDAALIAPGVHVNHPLAFAGIG